jgi:hypothetical protein
MSIISFDNLLTMHCKSCISPLRLSGACSVGFPDGLVRRIPLLGRGWASFFTREAWPYLHPFILNYIVLASLKFSTRVSLAALFTSIEIEVESVLA